MAKAKMNEKTDSSLEALKAKLEKDLGKGILFGANDKPERHDCISTGSIGLDMALGIGGLPKGRIVEIFGPESTGKTTMCLEVIAQAHKEDPEKRCAIVDTEHSIDTDYAKKLGVDMERLHISQPSCGEDALEVTRRLLDSKLFSVVVVDSVAALTPKSEIAGDAKIGDPKMGGQARLMSQGLKILAASASRSKGILMFTNQIREKIGVMFGSPETTSGGNALKFYASIRLDIRRSVSKENSISEGDVKIGNQTTVKVIKNKVAPPFRKSVFYIRFGQGIDKVGELLDLGVDADIITKSGSYFGYNGVSIGQGREKARQTIMDDPEMMMEIREKIISSARPQVFDEAEVEKEELEDAGE